MNINPTQLQRKKLVIAMSLTLVGSVMTGCSSSDGGSTSGEVTIKATGGSASSVNFASGGDGGELYVYNAGTTGGIEVSKEGTASTELTPPALPSTASLGTNPLNITSDTTIDTPVSYTAVADAAGTLTINQAYVDTNNVLRTSLAGGLADYANDPVVADSSFYRVNNEIYQALGDDTASDIAAAGMAYFRDTNSSIYLTDGIDGAVVDGGSDSVITGLSIASGATLSLSDNSGCNSNLSVNNDIDNNGTISKLNRNDCTLYLSSENYLAEGDVINAGTASSVDGGEIYLRADNGITNSGTINNSGFNSTDASGGDGGELMLDANAFIRNSGQLDASGGNGLNSGGNAGSVSMWGNPAYLENSGLIYANGGNSTGTGEDQGQGGRGGYVDLNADIILNNTSEAVVDSSGGNGTSGGNAGSVYFYQGDDIGAMINAANITVNGGIGDTQDGGSAGDIDFYTSRGAQIQNSAKLTAIGGDSNGAETGEGGQGGFINFYINSGSSATGDLVVSGMLDVSGGNAIATDGSSGGSAGSVSIQNEATTNEASDKRIALLGYSSIDTNGGDGAHGGRSNDVQFYVNDRYASDLGFDISGPVSNEVPINARGGNSTASGENTGEGGSGGYVELSTSNSTDIENTGINVTNSASIDVSGGTGSGDWGGNAGDIYLNAYQAVDNSGSLIANSGSGSSVSSAGSIELYSDGTLTNSAAITANGSTGVFDGGNGGEITMNAIELTNTASLSVNGGNATDTEESAGGNGGRIDLSTEGLLNLNNTGSFSYSFGTGVENGVEGCATSNFLSEGNCEVSIIFDTKLKG